jgi:hypothetical protein
MPRRMVRLAVFCLVSIAGGWAQAGFGALPHGKKTISLVANDGTSLTIGTATFTPDGAGAKVSVDMTAPEYQDEFLSMRPFRCLAGAKETWCHLEYPYQVPGHVTAGDLVDLEYKLLFLFKPPAGYGIDAWNGLYFKLTLQSDGSIAGKVHETDLNVLAVPPDDLTARVITHKDLTAVEPETHRFERLEIR